jgi:hypothetical protein
LRLRRPSRTAMSKADRRTVWIVRTVDWGEARLAREREP